MTSTVGNAEDLGQGYWTQFKLHATGGLYAAAGAGNGGATGAADYSQLLRSASITESSGEPARRTELVLDNSQQDQILAKDQLASLSVGTMFHLYGRKMEHFYETIQPSDIVRIFQGKTYNEGRDDDFDVSTRTYTTYDVATVLARTETYTVYNAKTMTQILGDIRKQYGIPVGVAVDTGVKVGQIITGAGWTLWRVLQEAAQRTFDRTGRRFMIRTNQDQQSIDLLEFGNTGVTWLVRAGGALERIHWNESAEETRTEVRMTDEQYSDDGAFQRIRTGAHAEAKGAIREVFGKMTVLIQPDGKELDPTLSTAEASFLNAVAQQRVNKELANLARTKKTATTTSLYLPHCRRGDTVQAGSPRTGGQVKWYIDSVVHDISPTEASTTLELVQDIRDAG